VWSTSTAACRRAPRPSGHAGAPSPRSTGPTSWLERLGGAGKDKRGGWVVQECTKQRRFRGRRHDQLRPAPARGSEPPALRVGLDDGQQQGALSSRFGEPPRQRVSVIGRCPSRSAVGDPRGRSFTPSLRFRSTARGSSRVSSPTRSLPANSPVGQSAHDQRKQQDIAITLREACRGEGARNSPQWHSRATAVPMATAGKSRVDPTRLASARALRLRNEFLTPSTA